MAGATQFILSGSWSMEAEKIILTLGESLGYVYGTVTLRIYL